MVAGGLPVISYTTRGTPLTSLTMRHDPRAERPLGRVMLRCLALRVREDLGDHLRPLDAGDDPELPPQRAQASITMPNTRVSCRAQFIAA